MEQRGRVLGQRVALVHAKIFIILLIGHYKVFIRHLEHLFTISGIKIKIGRLCNMALRISLEPRWLLLRREASFGLLAKLLQEILELVTEVVFGQFNKNTVLVVF